ncbi:GNAT family N-acetyltransferase (plasmid) [Streptomyces sp. BI20]|uniref:GNAT family N-acetyltransferase n=1 Tax=Streptomyces sp. BI20 TaxID=3403460 RepID=UPI003C769B5A
MTRMPQTNTPMTAGPDDAATIGRVLSRAFHDDSMMGWFFPDETAREATLAAYFTTIFTRQYARTALCERTADAAAFWVPAEARDEAVPDAETIAALLDLLGDRAGAFRDAVGAAASHTPAEPHWYLAVIGADPAAQGTGQGAALLRSGLAKADAAGLPAYLESSKEANLPFYEHFGFTVRDELSLPGGGPALWSMWREPGRPAPAA